MATIIEGVTNGTAKIALNNFIRDQLYRPRAQASGNPTTTVNSVDSVASSIVNSRAFSVFLPLKKAPIAAIELISVTDSSRAMA